MKTLWSIFSYILSTGIGGILLDIFEKKNNNATNRKVRAISSGIQINLIANDLNTNSSRNSKFVNNKDIKADLIYLNAWSEYIIQRLIDYKIMYHSASESLDDINSILGPLLKHRINKNSINQIKNYQYAYDIILNVRK